MKAILRRFYGGESRKILKWIFLLLSLTPSLSSARPPDESEFMAANLLGDEVAEWVVGLEPRPNSIGIFSIRSNYPLEQDYSAIVEAEIYKALTRRNMTNVMSCAECRSPQITVQDDRLVITKGAPDVETLKRIGLKYPVETFLSIDIYRTKLSVLAHAVLYQSPSGEVIKAERFNVAALSFADSSVQFLLTFGGGKLLGNGSSASSMIMSLNASLLEELGFAKGGLTVGSILGGPSMLIHVDPSLSFRGRFGTSALAYSVLFGVGYAFAGSARSIHLRGAYDLYLGSLTVIGVEGSYNVPITSVANEVDGYIGVHLGISLGR